MSGKDLLLHLYALGTVRKLQRQLDATPDEDTEGMQKISEDLAVLEAFRAMHGLAEDDIPDTFRRKPACPDQEKP